MSMETPIPTEKGTACVNGEISKLQDAKISVRDRGLLFGHAIFETLLILDGKIIGWNDHLARLAKGCEKTLISMPNPVQLRQLVRDTYLAHRQNFGDLPRKVQVRVQVSGGLSTALAVPRNEKGALLSPNVVIVCKNAPQYPESLFAHGMSLSPFPDSRSTSLVDVKSTSYLWNLLALEDARKKGAEDAVFVNGDGFLTECTTSNFLWVNQEGLLCSMPHKDHCLPGTTTAALARALHKHEHRINDLPLHNQELAQASVGIALSSVRGLVPVNRIGEHVFQVGDQLERLQYLNTILEEELLLGASPI
jgi:D-alanine transaminase